MIEALLGGAAILMSGILFLVVAAIFLVLLATIVAAGVFGLYVALLLTGKTDKADILEERIQGVFDKFFY